MKLIAAMRVKNESWVIKYTLSALSEFVDGIVIYDDGSVDDTVDICQSYEKVIEVVQREPGRGENDVDEANDWNLITKLALKHGADWILYTDADEMLEPAITEKIQSCMSQSNAGMYRFRKVSPWKSLHQYRTDSLRFDNIAENTLNPILVRANHKLKWDDGRGSFLKKVAKKILRGENFSPSLGRGFPKGISGDVINDNDLLSMHFNHLDMNRLIRKQVFYALVEKRMKPNRTRDDLVEWVSKGWSEDGMQLVDVNPQWYWSNYLSLIKYNN